MTSPLTVAEFRPPLVPRHNPSRGSLRSFSEQSLDLISPPTFLSSRSTSIGERPRLDGVSRPGSAVYLGDNVSTSDDQVERPPPSPISRMGSIASARVGLGSPQLNFGMEWAGGWFKGSSDVENARVEDDGFSDEEDPEEAILSLKESTVLADEEAAAEETAQFLVRVAVGRQSEKIDMDVLVDSVSGLPSPPRTDNGIFPFSDRLTRLYPFFLAIKAASNTVSSLVPYIDPALPGI
ncbi:MAG: hypothetical protein TREMPRED_001601 [Tremellales sp. Tagirdzhanova-0007]|nr:MAG: hypothetical protein TREMPRED_001601 [Tremellales sp. Tagirdzhanova-0007]